MAPPLPFPSNEIFQSIRRTLVSSGLIEIRTVSPELPGKSVNIASTRLGTRCCKRFDVDTACDMAAHAHINIFLLELDAGAALLQGVEYRVAVISKTGNYSATGNNNTFHIDL